MSAWKVCLLVLCVASTAGAGGWLLAKQKYKPDHDLVALQILGEHGVDMVIGQKMLMDSEAGNTEALKSSAANLVRLHFVPACQLVRQMPQGEHRDSLSRRLFHLSQFMQERPQLFENRDYIRPFEFPELVQTKETKDQNAAIIQQNERMKREFVEALRFANTLNKQAIEPSDPPK